MTSDRGLGTTPPGSLRAALRRLLHREPCDAWRKAYARQQEWMRAAKDERSRADRYEHSLTLLHSTGGGGFVALTRDEQAVVEDCIRVANERRHDVRPS